MTKKNQRVLSINPKFMEKWSFAVPSPEKTYNVLVPIKEGSRFSWTEQIQGKPYVRCEVDEVTTAMLIHSGKGVFLDRNDPSQMVTALGKLNQRMSNGIFGKFEPLEESL